ncbi:ribosomal RNA-processing protein 7 homolog A [Diorhabda sublineata]|uniref:ribosomal RNA-processing protein 7 homolog A n=1 Tax=Diorhabda sublineata TaxID=1163346 RepID=UPI0024E08F37|nr:ribosomal RNA-processing protein 7 homolog A [Diorhabda sublineata]
MSRNIQGFKVLPLLFSSKSTSCHEIFIKEHSVRIDDDSKPPGQTLFAINIPPIATVEGLKNAFSIVGKVRRVILENNKENTTNDGFRRAYIIFHKREQLLKVLKLEKLNPLSPDDKPVKIGLEQWIEDYNNSICDPNLLQQEINSFMKDFDSKESKAKAEEVVDDEGWTVVTKKGRKPGLSRKESVAKKLNHKLEKGAKKKELKNFYTFQIRESKMKNIATLRKNYEEAKKKVEMMKQARRFKPY